MLPVLDRCRRFGFFAGDGPFFLPGIDAVSSRRDNDVIPRPETRADAPPSRRASTLRDERHYSSAVDRSEHL